MIKKIIAFLFTIFVVIQFFKVAKNETSVPQTEAITAKFPVPDSIQNILKTSCYDCHSNNTKYPWYNMVQPVSWLLNSHIQDGKKHLNFDEFGTYTTDRQKHKLDDITEVLQKHEMPLGSYTFIHTDAKLSESQQQALINWAVSMKNQIK